MVNAVVPSRKPSGFGWLQFEKGLQELQKLAIRSPAAMGTLLYLVNNMSRSNALVVSQTAIAAGIGAKRERESSPEIPPRTQFHPERESRRCNRLRGQQQGRLAGEPGRTLRSLRRRCAGHRGRTGTGPDRRPEAAQSVPKLIEASGCSLAMSRSTRQTKASWNSHSQGRAGWLFPLSPPLFAMS